MSNREKGTLAVSSNMEVLKASPLDSRGVVKFKAALTANETWMTADGQSYLYVGMTTSVVADPEDENNGVYMLSKLPFTNINNWTRLGGILEIETMISSLETKVQTIEDILPFKADLVDGKVPASQLPSYVSDIVEVANFRSLPTTGTPNVIYITLDTNITYRWSGSAYTEISKSIALGETAETAHRGDHGKLAYSHISRVDNPHQVTKAQVGLSNVDNTSDMDKPISTSTQEAIDVVNAKFNNTMLFTAEYVDDTIPTMNINVVTVPGSTTS